MSYEEAATLPYGAVMAVSLLKKAGVQPGQNVPDQRRFGRHRGDGRPAGQI
ncbi:MAG: hypothetical protein MZV64_11975 [Ignavibacteriales bacterium]|nr:hypothetical protein [Ignavibacteriales bacterium]